MSTQQSKYTEPEQYQDTEVGGKFRGRRHIMKTKPKKGTEPIVYCYSNTAKKPARIKYKVIPDRYEPVRTTASKYKANGKLKPTWIALQIWRHFNDQDRMENFVRR